jgi:hypothetical protein
MKIKATMEQAYDFVATLAEKKNASHKYNYNLGENIKDTVEKHIGDVFKDHSKTYHIPTKKDLVRRIKARDMTPDGKPYSKDYLDKKRERSRLFQPHTYQRYGFWHNILVKGKDLNVKIGLYNHPVTEKGFDWISHHEERRSVLKALLLLSWEDVLETIIKTYAINILAQGRTKVRKRIFENWKRRFMEVV